MSAFGNGLTNLHEIRHGYAYLPSEQVRHLKFPTPKSNNVVLMESINSLLNKW